jgi:hypothetical protein
VNLKARNFYVIYVKAIHQHLPGKNKKKLYETLQAGLAATGTRFEPVNFLT